LHIHTGIILDELYPWHSLNYLQEEGVFQGRNADEELDENGNLVGLPHIDYDTGLPVTYAEAVATAASGPESQTVEQYGDYAEETVEPPDAAFLAADDEWLAKVRQVRPF
jgi:hypothetical protein